MAVVGDSKIFVILINRKDVNLIVKVLEPLICWDDETNFVGLIKDDYCCYDLLSMIKGKTNKVTSSIC